MVRKQHVYVKVDTWRKLRRFFGPELSLNIFHTFLYTLWTLLVPAVTSLIVFA